MHNKNEYQFKILIKGSLFAIDQRVLGKLFSDQQLISNIKEFYFTL